MTAETIAQMTTAERAAILETGVTKRQLVKLTDDDRAVMLVANGRLFGITSPVATARPGSWLPRAAAELQLRRIITHNLLTGAPRHYHGGRVALAK